MSTRLGKRGRLRAISILAGLALLVALGIAMRSASASTGSPGSLAVQAALPASIKNGVGANRPSAVDAFAHLEPAGPVTILVGQQFTLDLMINAGSNNVAAEQSYLSFNSSILQNVLVGSPGCGTITNTVTADIATLETTLQNQVCNGPGQCNFGSIVTPPGSVGYAAGAFSHPAAGGDFRVASMAFCGTAPGDTVLHWQFTPPDPVARNSDIVDASSNSVADRTSYVDYEVHVVAPTATPTSTPVNVNAFAHLEPAGPMTVLVGQQFTLALMIDAGTNNVGAAQSYMTFTNSILQNVQVGSVGCATITSTLTADTTRFDTPLQNEVCNGPGQCPFHSTLVDPGSIAYASGAFSNPVANGDFRVARAAFCATTTGDALVHWQFTPPDPVDRNSDIVDEFSASVANRTFYTDYVVHVVTPTATPTFTPTSTPTRTPTNTPTNTPTSTPTFTRTATPTPGTRLVGHVTWQGRPAQPNAVQSLPITLTLRLSGGGPDNEFSTTTDASGFFTVTAPAPGLYNWRVKGPNGTPNTNTTPGFLARSGSVTISAGTTNQEMGLLPAGDCNNTNNVDATDFTILKGTFGKSVGQLGYDARAEFSGDNVVNATDFTLLKGTFGTAGSPAIGPTGP